MENEEAKPKDAGLLVMLLLVVLGTLVMGWVADQNQHEPLTPTKVVESPESR